MATNVKAPTRKQKRATSSKKVGVDVFHDRPIPFTVSSELLRELGERLVGKPYIALAELVKNSYDADAQHCVIRFEGDRIEIIDDGHGMTSQEFQDFWMRIGSTHKVQQERSSKFERALTGSKGVGRLAVQFLAERVEVVTTSETTPDFQLNAKVDWNEAIEAEELTHAKALCSQTERTTTYTNENNYGTRIILESLNQDWGEEEFKDLAREIWVLNPPFAEAVRDDEADLFQVTIETLFEEIEEKFERQMTAALRQWEGRIEGEIRDGRHTRGCRLLVEFDDGDKYDETIPIPDCVIDRTTFEIRVFRLSGRQYEGIKVGEARDYFSRFGGVQVYDSGFRLPYYGQREQDWLGIEVAHSHRLHSSKLLPKNLQVSKALFDLPTNQRIFGVVRISTGGEFRKASRHAQQRGNYLKVQVTRDRLVNNRAYDQLRDTLRWALDYYATRVRLRRLEQSRLAGPEEPPGKKLDQLREKLSEYQTVIPAEAHTDLDLAIGNYVKTVEKEERYIEEQRALLAPLAAAGMAALAFEHEANREITRLGRIAKNLKRLATKSKGKVKEVGEIADELTEWVRRVRASRRLFSPLSNVEDREKAQRLRLRTTIEIIARNTRPFLRDISVETNDIPDDLLLPIGTLAQWQALFQNVFTNAVNAMLDSEERRIVCRAGIRGNKRRWLTINDTGVGADLENSEKLFEPFQRELEISRERQAIGLGGQGLGLTIVRMIAESRECRVGFAEPEPPFSTSFEITWSSTA